MIQSWIFSIITPVFCHMRIQKSFWYADLLLKIHLSLLLMLNMLCFLYEEKALLFQDSLNGKYKWSPFVTFNWLKVTVNTFTMCYFGEKREKFDRPQTFEQ